uniref:Uncharacterized protein n=1 Tax=Panagrolaimus sp. ES5 TaxID=591445 RepID=A0AC34FN25_9BILA
MDSSDSDTSSDSETTISTSSSSASSSTTLYGKVRTTSEMIIDKSIKARFYASYRHQEFSLPDSIMHYMAMNPKNAKIYQKLIRSCKYFFVKNQILVISSLQYDSKSIPPSNGSAINFKTFKELLKIFQFLKLKGCTLRDIAEDFDLDTFYKYMKKNKHTSIKLFFCDTISEAYETRLQTIVDEIVESEIREFKPPYIFYHGQDEKMRDNLWELHNRRA